MIEPRSKYIRDYNIGLLLDAKTYGIVLYLGPSSDQEQTTLWIFNVYSGCYGHWCGSAEFHEEDVILFDSGLKNV